MHFDSDDMKPFYATMEKRIIMVKCGSPIVRLMIVGVELVTDRNQVNQIRVDDSDRY